METILIEVKNDGEILSMMDGSEWMVEATDTPTVCTWIPTANIKIDRTSSGYTITNLEIDINVRASKIN
jgi:hypothetical protein